MTNLLVLSGDPALSSILADHLTSLGSVDMVADTAQIGARLSAIAVHLVIIDMGWGEAIPVLSSALAGASRPPAVLALGKECTFSDAWLAKPLRLHDLLDAARALLKRQQNQQSSSVALTNECIFYPQEKRLELSATGQFTALTDIESRIVEYLLSHKNQVISRESMLGDIWGYNDQVTTHTLETHIYRLRNKIEGLGAKGVEITTGEGGYKLEL